MRRFLLTMVALLAMVFVSMGTSSAGWAWNGGTWKIVPNPTPDSSKNSSLRSVAAVSSHDVWAIGYYYDTQAQTYNALIEHWNGAKWKIVPSPNPSKNGLNAVAADRATDAWAVGFTNTGTGGGILTEHWNGSKWSVVPSPNPTGTTSSGLFAVTVLSPNNAWAVGAYSTSSDMLTLIEHWNGHQWSIVKSPNRPSAPHTRNQLSGIAAVSANNIWAAGTSGVGTGNDHTLIEHWNGSKWSIVPSPNGSQFGNRLFGVAALSTNDAWAVGNYSPQSGELPPYNTLVEHWNGTKWSIVPSPNVAGAHGNGLQGVTIISQRDVWAVGSTSSDRVRALIVHWDGSKWRIVASPTGTSESGLNAVTRVPGTNNAWAVGDIFKNNGRFTLTLFHG
jgi:hypothetical protein